MTSSTGTGPEPGAGASGVNVGGGDQGATFEGETTGPGGDTSPAVTESSPAHPSVTDEAQEVVADVYNPDDERQDDGDVDREPTAENGVVVDSPNLSPELADAVAAEINAAEQGDAATASLHAPGGESAPDPE